MSKRNPRRANGAKRDAVRRAVASRGEPCWMCGHPIDWTLPRGNPLAGEVDEIVPVSRGGSPYDPSNCAGAHRCCNEWRAAKPVGQVDLVRRLVAETGQTASPLDWVHRARLVASHAKTSSITSLPTPTTDW